MTIETDKYLEFRNRETNRQSKAVREFTESGIPMAPFRDQKHLQSEADGIETECMRSINSWLEKQHKRPIYLQPSQSPPDIRVYHSDIPQIPDQTSSCRLLSMYDSSKFKPKEISESWDYNLRHAMNPFLPPIENNPHPLYNTDYQEHSKSLPLKLELGWVESKVHTILNRITRCRNYQQPQALENTIKKHFKKIIQELQEGKSTTPNKRNQKKQSAKIHEQRNSNSQKTSTVIGVAGVLKLDHDDIRLQIPLQRSPRYQDLLEYAKFVHSCTMSAHRGDPESPSEIQKIQLDYNKKLQAHDLQKGEINSGNQIWIALGVLQAISSANAGPEETTAGLFNALAFIADNPKLSHYGYIPRPKIGSTLIPLSTDILISTAVIVLASILEMERRTSATTQPTERLKTIIENSIKQVHDPRCVSTLTLYLERVNPALLPSSSKNRRNTTSSSPKNSKSFIKSCKEALLPHLEPHNIKMLHVHNIETLEGDIHAYSMASALQRHLWQMSNKEIDPDIQEKMKVEIDNARIQNAHSIETRLLNFFHDCSHYEDRQMYKDTHNALQILSQKAISRFICSLNSYNAKCRLANNKHNVVPIHPALLDLIHDDQLVVLNEILEFPKLPNSEKNPIPELTHITKATESYHKHLEKTKQTSYKKHYIKQLEMLRVDTENLHYGKNDRSHPLVRFMILYPKIEDATMQKTTREALKNFNWHRMPQIAKQYFLKNEFPKLHHATPESHSNFNRTPAPAQEMLKTPNLNTDNFASTSLKGPKSARPAQSHLATIDEDPSEQRKQNLRFSTSVHQISQIAKPDAKRKDLFQSAQKAQRNASTNLATQGQTL